MFDNLYSVGEGKGCRYMDNGWNIYDLFVSASQAPGQQMVDLSSLWEAQVDVENQRTQKISKKRGCSPTHASHFNDSH